MKRPIRPESPLRERFLTGLGFPRLWRDDRERLWQFMRLWLPRVVGALAPARGYGLERMPGGGGLVVAVNHFSAIDPPLVGSFSRRALYYLTKAAEPTPSVSCRGRSSAHRAHGGRPPD